MGLLGGLHVGGRVQSKGWVEDSPAELLVRADFDVGSGDGEREESTLLGERGRLKDMKEGGRSLVVVVVCSSLREVR